MGLGELGALGHPPTCRGGGGSMGKPLRPALGEMNPAGFHASN